MRAALKSSARSGMLIEREVVGRRRGEAEAEIVFPDSTS